MTTVSGVNNTAASTTITKNKTLGQDEFLTLLVAQLKYQDPLNPSDPTEFTSQLAQYSQLEQLFNLNDAMGALTQAQNKSERLSALSLIGQEIVVEDSTFSLGSDPVQIGYRVDGTASEASLVIKNNSGRTVATLPVGDLSAGNHFLTWDGKDSSGNTLTSGTYTITINAKGANGTSATVSPLVRSKVTGIDLSGSEPQIVTALGEYKISSIHGAYTSNQAGSTGNSG